MSRFRRIEVFEPSPCLYVKETSILFSPPTLTFPSLDDFMNPPNLTFFPLDLFPHCFLPNVPSPCEIFDSVTDLIQIEKTPISSSYKRFQARTTPDSYLRTLTDRVSALELGLDRLVKETTCNSDRKYSWTAVVKGAQKDGGDRKYKLMAEIKGSDSDPENKKKKKKKGSKAWSSKRVVEIEEPIDQRVIALRRVSDYFY